MGEAIPRKECNDHMNDLRKEIDNQIKGVYKTISTLETKIDNKVSYKSFYWVIGALGAILAVAASVIIGVLGYMSSQIKDVQDKQYQLNKDVSGIVEVFNKYDISVTK